MGYFGYVYLVDAIASPPGVQVSTSVLGADMDSPAYFSWGTGARPPGLHEYARGTLFSDKTLRLLPGYPVVEQSGQGGSDSDGRCLIEASFSPRHGDDPVLFHFLLPERFVPRRTAQPLEQPCRPFVSTLGERIVATYPVIGPAVVRFWIARLETRELMQDYDLTKILHPDEQRTTRAEFEFNLGIFKVKIA